MRRCLGESSERVGDMERTSRRLDDTFMDNEGRVCANCETGNLREIFFIFGCDGGSGGATVGRGGRLNTPRGAGAGVGVTSAACAGMGSGGSGRDGELSGFALLFRNLCRVLPLGDAGETGA